MISRIVPLLTLALLGAGCSLRSAGAGQDQDPDGPSLSFSKVSIAEFDGARRLWDLHAAEVVYDHEVARLRDVKVQVYRDRTVSATCQAPAADFDTTTRDLSLAGPVRMVAQGGRAVLRAENISWIGSAARLVARGRIEILHGPSRLQAFGLEADQATSRVILAGPVEGKFRIAHPGMDGRWQP